MTGADDDCHPDLQPFTENNEMLMFSVKDSGTGIKEEDMGKLFKLYGFIQETKEINTRGIGLGLHICRKIIREMGGEIICNSIWGRGSTFTFVVKTQPVLLDKLEKVQSARILHPIATRVF